MGNLYGGNPVRDCGFAGCSGGGESSAPPASDNSSGGNSSGGTTETLNIAYFGPHQDNEYQIGLREAVEEAAKAKNVNCKVYIADNDPAKQISQIEQAIAEGVDGIIIDPVSFDGITTAVAAAKTAKIPFVTVHESVSTQDDCTAFVGSNLRAGGKLKMEQVMKDFPNGADLGILYGPLGQTAQIDITEGYQDALKEAGKEDQYKTVFDGEANWNSEDALELVSNWLSTGKISTRSSATTTAWQSARCRRSNRPAKPGKSKSTASTPSRTFSRKSRKATSRQPFSMISTAKQTPAWTCLLRR